MEWNNIVIGLFPIGLIVGVAIGILAFKYQWKLIDWF